MKLRLVFFLLHSLLVAVSLTADPTGQPTGQPTTQPTTQPTSSPTLAANGGIWRVKVTSDGDAAYNGSTANPCTALHWNLESSSCTLRAAVYFCIEVVPWSTIYGIASAPSQCIISLNSTAYQSIQLNAGAISLPAVVPAANISLSIHADGVSISQSVSSDRAFYMKQSSAVTFRFILQDTSMSNIGSSSSLVDGGAFYASGISSFYMMDVSFQNTFGASGGAIYLVNITNAELESVQFVSSTGTSGSGIFTRDVKSLLIKNSTFSGGTASTVGGAIAIENSESKVEVCSSQFLRNSAVYHGGAISLHKCYGTVILNGLNFSENAAPYGSSVVMKQVNSGTLDSSIFSFNSVLSGGTIYWIKSTGESSMDPPILGSNNQFVNNSWGNGQRDLLNITSELVNIVPSVNQLYFDNYGSDTSLSMSSRVYDHYGNTLVDIANFKLTVEKKYSSGCSYNADRAYITGSSASVSSDGYTNFGGFGILCIPGGNTNVSIVASFPIKATNFPLYVVPSAAEFVSFDLMERDVIQTVPITMRKCVIGEYYDFRDSSSRSRCFQCENSYSLRNASDNSVIRCEDCPVGSHSCYRDTVFLNPGTWRYTKYTSTIFDCPLKDGCLGGESFGDSACGPGHTGALCGVCADGYAESADRSKCEMCTSGSSFSPSEQFLIPSILLAFVLFVVIIYYVLRHYHHHVRAYEIHPDDSEHIQFMKEHMYNQEKWFEQLMKQSSKIKILFGTYQIIVLLPENLRLKYPYLGYTFNHFVRLFQFVNFDLVRAIPISCYRTWNYIDSMKSVTAIPLAICIVLLIVYFLYLRYYDYQYRPKNRHPQHGLEAYFSNKPLVTDEDEENYVEEFQVMKQHIFSRFVFTVVIVSYLVVPGVLLNVVRLYDCIDLDPNNENIIYSDASQLFMRMDLSVDCTSKEYDEGLKIVMATLFVYPIALLILYYSLWNKAKGIAKIIINKEHADFNLLNVAAPIRFLFTESYKPEFYFWEFVEIGKRGLLIVVLSVMEAGTQFQIVCGLVISITFHKLNMHYKPYEKDRDNELAEIAGIQIIFTFACFLLIKSQSFGDYRLEEPSLIYSTIDYLMTIVNSVLLLVILGYGFLGIYHQFNLESKFSNLKEYVKDLCGYTKPHMKEKKVEEQCQIEEKVIEVRSVKDKEDEEIIEEADDLIGSLLFGNAVVGAKNQIAESESRKTGMSPADTAKHFINNFVIGAASRRVNLKSFVDQTISEALKSSSLRKSKGQLKHLKMKNRRETELVFMRQNYRDLLLSISQPGNSLIGYFDESNFSDLDLINDHKRHLEDSLLTAESMLEDEVEQRTKVFVESGLPYDDLGNLADTARAAKEMTTFFNKSLWMSNVFALEDNRLDMISRRDAEIVDHDEEDSFIDATTMKLDEYVYEEPEEVLTDNEEKEGEQQQNNAQYEISDDSDMDEEDSGVWEEVKPIRGTYDLSSDESAVDPRTSKIAYDLSSDDDDDNDDDDDEDDDEVIVRQPEPPIGATTYDLSSDDDSDNEVAIRHPKPVPVRKSRLGANIYDMSDDDY